MSKDNGGKPGRPRAADTSGEMVKITFRLDAAGDAALTALEEEFGGPPCRGRRSLTLRKLVVDAFEQLEARRAAQARARSAAGGDD